VLVDTGPLVGILDQSEEHHEICVEHLRLITGPLLTCWPVITAAAWLLRALPGAIARLLSSFGGQPLTLLSLDETDLAGISAIFAKYCDLGIQLADASLAHLANREGVDTIFTLNRRDFGVLRLARGRKFRLIP
jgi:predicted nucleic acid-binding protein